MQPTTWHRASYVVPLRRQADRTLFVEFQPFRGVFEIESVLSEPPMRDDVAVRFVKVGHRGVAADVFEAESGLRADFPKAQFRVCIRFRGEKPDLARPTRSPENYWRPRQHLESFSEPDARAAEEYPSFSEINAKRKEATPDAPSADYFADLDAETYTKEGHPASWSRVDAVGTLLTDAERDERTKAVESLSASLFARVRERAKGTWGYLPDPTPDEKDWLLLVEKLHLALVDRHFTSNGLGTDAVGEAYACFGNLELRKDIVLASGGAEAYYQNGVPNTFYFANVAELFAWLAEWGVEKEKWRDLLPYALAGLAMMTKCRFRCAHTFDDYDLDDLGTSMDLSERDEIVARFLAMDEAERVLAWRKVLRLAAPVSTSPFGAAAPCSDVEKEIDDFLVPTPPPAPPGIV
ncbi:MAG: hypothetical protein R3F34_05175 [Planctomycetota bacterium]